MSRRTVYGPDGRQWQVGRRVESGSLVSRLLRRARWVVEAQTDDDPPETRHWYAGKRSEADDLVQEIAMALRTGSEGPPQPED